MLFAKRFHRAVHLHQRGSRTRFGAAAAKFADRYNANHDTWWFVTGDKGDLRFLRSTN